MAPRYHSTKTVSSNGYKKYNGGKGFDDSESPLIVNKDFYNQYKRNMDLVGPGGVQREFTKPKHGSPEFHKQNELGLEKAYNSPNYLYKDNDTLYVAGTQTRRDVWDDLKIPFGLTRYSQRYEDADKIIKQDPSIKSLVGHSLGGSVALEFQKNYPDRDFQAITYNAPVNSVTPSKDRFRGIVDPVSYQDYGAQIVLKMPSTSRDIHSYKDFSTGTNLSNHI